MKYKLKKLETFNETKGWFFDKITKVDKPIARAIEIKRERAQINKSEIKKEKLYRHHRNTKPHKSAATTHQENGLPRRHAQILGKEQSPKTEPGRNRKYEQINYQ